MSGVEGICERVSPSSKATHGGGWRSFGAGGGAGTGPAATGPAASGLGRCPHRRTLPRPPRLTPGAGGSQWVSGAGLWGSDTRFFLGGGGECCLRTWTQGRVRLSSNPALPLPSSVIKLPNLCLGFLILNMGLIRVPTSRVVARVKLVNSCKVPGVQCLAQCYIMFSITFSGVETSGFWPPPCLSPGPNP